MRKLSILVFQTLNGVMQAPSVPEEDFSRNFRGGGWAAPYWETAMEQVVRHAMSEPYDLLLGRNTYNLFASSFSAENPDNPISNQLFNAQKYVVTSEPESITWYNSQVIDADIIKSIEQLKAKSGPLIQVHGSWQLIQTLIANDLVDEYRLWTFPVIVQGGKRLFEEADTPKRLKLAYSEACDNGVLMSIWHR